MMLEDIAKVYGMNDYYDYVSGKIYQLSEAVEDADDSSRLRVPVISRSGCLVEYASMAKVYV